MKDSTIVSICSDAPSLKLAITTVVFTATVAVSASDLPLKPVGQNVEQSFSADISLSSTYNSTISVKQGDSISMGDEILDKNLHKLSVFGEYQKNWNGYGATPFTPELLSITKDLLMHLTIQPQIFPVDSNIVQFEYEKKNSPEYLEFEVASAELVSAFRIDDKEQEHYFSIERSASAINEVVNEFYGY